MARFVYLQQRRLFRGCLTAIAAKQGLCLNVYSSIFFEASTFGKA
jgi:hypothetical protein